MGFHIVAIVKAKEGKIDELNSYVGKIMEHVQAKEPDTLQYQIVSDSNKPNEFVVFEEYTDEAAFEFHKASDAFQAFAKAVPELCEGGTVDIKKTQLVKRHFANGFPSKL